MVAFPDFTFEEKYWQDGYVVIGIDEVGRGCLAGPVTVGGVSIDSKNLLKNEWLQLGVNDSKKLSAKTREKLVPILMEKCMYSTASVNSEKINELGIVTCIKLAMSKVVQNIQLHFPSKQIILLIDGLPISHIPYINDIPRVSIIKGDGKSISIAAASIIAKVERDLYMSSLSTEFPDYDWVTNKGYGTLKHRSAIQKHGISPHHRTLYIRKILSNVARSHSL